jgi:hypothetical protein
MDQGARPGRPDEVIEHGPVGVVWRLLIQE